MSSKVSASILVVDDERNVRLMYRAALDSMFTVHEADSAARALEMFKARRYDVAILDLRMPDMTGLELLEQMNERGITTPVVFITAYADVPNAVSAMKFGAIDFLQKPITPDQLPRLQKMSLSATPSRIANPRNRMTSSISSVARSAPSISAISPPPVPISSALSRSTPIPPQALNLAGVMFEMREEFDQARRYYGRAIKINSDFEPAQANMRRIYELFHFGSSEEPFNLENH